MYVLRSVHKSSLHVTKLEKILRSKQIAKQKTGHHQQPSEPKLRFDSVVLWRSAMWLWDHQRVPLKASADVRIKAVNYIEVNFIRRC